MNYKFADERKAIARLLVGMLYQERYSTRNLGWIYRRYAKYLFGVSFETFSSYLDAKNDPLDHVEIPTYIVVGLWEMVNVPRCTDRIPEDLRRRLAQTNFVKSRGREEPALWVPEHDGRTMPYRAGEGDEERRVDKKIVAETAV